MEKAVEILLVEDDTLLSDMTTRVLARSGYAVTAAYSGSEALLLMEKQHFDLILLDLMLPGLSGETVLERIKEAWDIPIIGVSAKADLDSKVNLMRGGADDYITKPFDNEELLVRMEAVLRRYQKSVQIHHDILRFKDLSLNTDTMEVKIGDCPISLTRYEYLILQLLMSAPSKVFTKNNIFESVWNETFIGDDNAINVHIGNLRKKFSKVNADEQYIQTVWGLGFKMQDLSLEKRMKRMEDERGRFYGCCLGHTKPLLYVSRWDGRSGHLSEGEARRYLWIVRWSSCGKDRTAPDYDWDDPAAIGCFEIIWERGI